MAPLLRLSGTFHPGGPVQYTACGILLLPEMDFRFLRPLYFVARNQYGIYLWHMPIIMILQANSPWFNTMSQQRFWLFLPCMVVITCVFGYFATRFIDHPASAKKKG